MRYILTEVTPLMSTTSIRALCHYFTVVFTYGTAKITMVDGSQKWYSNNLPWQWKVVDSQNIFLGCAFIPISNFTIFDVKIQHGKWIIPCQDACGIWHGLESEKLNTVHIYARCKLEQKFLLSCNNLDIIFFFALVSSYGGWNQWWPWHKGRNEFNIKTM